MTWERVQQDLVRTRRDRLTREIGPGPHVSEIAHHQVEASMLRRTAAAFEREAVLLAADGLSPQAADARSTALRLHVQAAEEDARAARLEAEQVGASDTARYVDLRAAIRAIARDVAARDRANELCQALTRIGPRAAEVLWRELQRRCATEKIPIPADLETRFRELLRAADAQRALVLPPRTTPGETPRELLLATDALVDEAARLCREDLFDRIEAQAGRLKALQEESWDAFDEDERGLVRRAFGVLSRISREFQPGWTATLDGKITGQDWRGIAEAAARRLAERAERRKAAVASERRKQVGEALRDLHEAERRMVYQEALERLRARFYELDHAAPEDAVWVLREARTQAAIACRAAAGDEERLERLAAALGERAGAVAAGRVFRPLWRALGIAPDEEAAANGTPAPAAEPPGQDLDAEEVEFTTGDLLDDEWPPTILQARGAGARERVLLVGGIPSEERKRLLREFFGWDDVAWEESYRDHSADFRGLRTRINNRAFDRVIVLSRFCGHDVTQGLGEATRRAGIPYHVHPRGVSVTALATYVYPGASATY